MMSRAISFCKLGVPRAIKVSRCYLLNMDKIRRTSIDEATSSAIDELLTDRGFSNREFDRATDGAITYSRIRDIRSGLRGPIRLSEFLIICQTCEVDPVATLREIIEAARVYESRERLPSPSPSSVPACPRPDADDDVAAAIRDHERYGLAANTDGNRDVEAETPDW